MDELLRLSFLPDLHLRIVSLGNLYKRLFRPRSQPARCFLQHHRFRLYNVPRVNMVLPHRKSPTDQDRESHDQALASITSQHSTIARNLLHRHCSIRTEVIDSLASSRSSARCSMGNILPRWIYRRIPIAHPDLPNGNRLPTWLVASHE